jgi:hypothetical protein
MLNDEKLIRVKDLLVKPETKIKLNTKVKNSIKKRQKPCLSKAANTWR